MKKNFIKNFLVASLIFFIGIASVQAKLNKAENKGAGRMKAVNLAYAAYDFISDEAVDWYAEHAGLLIIGAWQKDKMRAIKAKNPNITILLYKIALSKKYEDQGAGGYERVNAAHPEWFLLDKDGKRIADTYDEYSRENVFIMDWGNPGWQKYWCDSVLNEAVKDGWDGVFIDCACAGINSYWAPNGVLQYKDNVSFGKAVEGFLAYCHKRFKKAGKLVVPNSVECVVYPGCWEERLKVTDGGVDEGFVNIYGWWPGSLWRSEGEWERQISYLETTGEKGKIFFAMPHNRPSNRQDLLYSAASFLLGKKGDKNFFYSDVHAGGYNYKNYVENYDAYKDIYTTKIGRPVAGRYKAQGVWQRDYSGGKVLVNNTQNACEVDLKKPYKQLDGTVVKSVKLDGHTGVVLLAP